jgi:hypothetical protein
MNFPKFLKFSQGNKIVQIFSLNSFEEIRKIGSFHQIQHIEVTTHSDRLYVQDMLALDLSYFISETEYFELKSSILKRTQLLD